VASLRRPAFSSPCVIGVVALWCGGPALLQTVLQGFEFAANQWVWLLHSPPCPSLRAVGKLARRIESTSRSVLRLQHKASQAGTLPAEEHANRQLLMAFVGVPTHMPAVSRVGAGMRVGVKFG